MPKYAYRNGVVFQGPLVVQTSGFDFKYGVKFCSFGGVHCDPTILGLLLC